MPSRDTNFRFIAKNLDVSKILKQVLSNPDDWKAVSKFENTLGDKDPYGFLPLQMAVVRDASENVKDSELLRRTVLYDKYTEIHKFWKSYGIKKPARCAFFKLPVGGAVGSHIDDGTYYLKKDRYHLSLQGKYRYECNGEEHIIEPGTFFWFSNKLTHSALNVGDVDRITFVFDVPHNKNNP